MPDRKPDRLLLASIHDVSPRFESEIERLLDLLRPHVGTTLAMLVVPNHWGDCPIVAGSPFAGRLRAWAEAGIDMFLHGFTHRDQSAHAGAMDRIRGQYFTAGEGEFLGLSRAEAVERISSGRALLEQVTGRPIAGFVAPAWLYGQATLEALEDCAMPIAEDHFRVWSPASGAKLARGPVVTWASRTRARLASSLLAAPLVRSLPIPALRVAVHPPDSRHPVLVRSIDATLRAAVGSRRAAGYSELLAA